MLLTFARCGRAHRSLLAGASAASLVLALAASAHADVVGDCINASTAGQTLRKADKLVAARDRLLACARPACPAIVRTHCARWVAAVEAATPSIVVRALDPSGIDVLDARVAIDGKAGPVIGSVVSLDPGEHVVAVAPHDGAWKEKKVALAAGERARLVVVRFDPPPPAAHPGGAPPPARRSWAPPAVVDATSAEPVPAPGHRVSAGAWVLGGVGLATLGVGAYFLVEARSEWDHLSATCSPFCTSAQTQTGRTDALVGDVLLGVGGAALGFALIWAFAFPERTNGGSVASGLRLDLGHSGRGRRRRSPSAGRRDKPVAPRLRAGCVHHGAALRGA